jgi:hypothetical protein
MRMKSLQILIYFINYSISLLPFLIFLIDTFVYNVTFVEYHAFNHKILITKFISKLYSYIIIEIIVIITIIVEGFYCIKLASTLVLRFDDF